MKNHGILLSSLATRYSSFPLLFVYGRNDATVPFYGAKIYPADLERVINEDPVLSSEIHSFQLKVIEDEQLKNKLQVHLELSKNRSDRLRPEIENLQELIFNGLIRVNQDFREVTKMFDRDQVQLFLYEYETGPFAGRDIRIKNKYIQHESAWNGASPVRAAASKPDQSEDRLDELVKDFRERIALRPPIGRLTCI